MHNYHFYITKYEKHLLPVLKDAYMQHHYLTCAGDKFIGIMEKSIISRAYIFHYSKKDNVYFSLHLTPAPDGLAKISICIVNKAKDCIKNFYCIPSIKFDSIDKLFVPYNLWESV